MPLLHGDDLPKGTKSVNVICKELRIAPENFGAPMVMDLVKEVFGKSAWAVNKTNIRAIAEKYDLGDDPELEELAQACAGKKFTLTVVMVNNPKTKKMVRSLFVA